MSEEKELRGERVNSKVYVPMKQALARKAQGMNKKIVELIPFWPETIGLPEISKAVGISQSAINARMPGIQEEFLVFQHGTVYSRIKPDFSNLDFGQEES